MAYRRALLGIVPQCVQPPPICWIALDDGHALAVLDGLHRGPFAAGAGADHDHVEMLVGHGKLKLGTWNAECSGRRGVGAPRLESIGFAAWRENVGEILCEIRDGRVRMPYGALRPKASQP